MMLHSASLKLQHISQAAGTLSVGFWNHDRCKIIWFSAVAVDQIKLLCLLFCRLRAWTETVITAQMRQSVIKPQ